MTKLIRNMALFIIIGVLLLFILFFFWFRHEIFPPAIQKHEGPETLLKNIKLKSTSPLVFAHRGDHFFQKENSTRSVLQAIERGYSGVELDLGITSDGVPVLIHDLSIEKNGKETLIMNLSFSELKQVEPEVEKLETMLDHAGGKVLMILEIKSLSGDSGGLDRVLCQELETRQLWDTVIVSSTDYFTIRKLQSGCKKARIMFEFSGNPDILKQILSAGYPSTWISVSKSSMDRSLADWLAARGFIVSIYTPDTASEIKEAIGFGARIIQTDSPGQATHIIQSSL